MYNEAVVNTLAGRKPDALNSLARAFQNGYPAAEARNDPELNALHQLPEFAGLVKKFGSDLN